MLASYLQYIFSPQKLSAKGGVEQNTEDGGSVDKRLRTGLPRILTTRALPRAASTPDPGHATGYRSSRGMEGNGPWGNEAAELPAWRVETAQPYKMAGARRL
ncbi:hypothetical protein NDU88_000834 [Pleurodeles waltl]|uniref:Uncharacterized protein n=1 Tax=Pleurodeles waltl TaxID=8319 RepID=A0AAV7VUP0_PLEWA|nr:hypothetical protein NDU88_000834 [Pleurodeles waltl]